MKPLPNFDNVEAMADRGRRSLLGTLRKEATEALRDAHTAVDHCEWSELYQRAANAHAAVERLMTLASIWNELDDNLVPLLQESIKQAKERASA